MRPRGKCLQLTAPDFSSWAMALLRCAFALGVYSLLYMALVLRPRHSFGAPSCLVSTAYSTWRCCFGYGTATVRIRGQLTAPDFSSWTTAHLRIAFALGAFRLLHLALLLGLRHSYGAPSRLVSTSYCTWRWCLVCGKATVRPRAK